MKGPRSSAAPARFCTRCGHELKQEANFCPRCGQKVVGLDDQEDVGPILPELAGDPEWRPRQRSRQGQSYVVEEGQEVDEDVYLEGGFVSGTSDEVIGTLEQVGDGIRSASDEPKEWMNPSRDKPELYR
jgi:hypothetical protein